MRIGSPEKIVRKCNYVCHILLLTYIWDMIRVGLKITKEKNMGLDQYAHLRGKEINWKKYYSDDEKESKEEAEHVFIWRKHARLQTFFARKWGEQNEAEQTKRNKRLSSHPMDLSHLGFNAGDEVYITEEVVRELEEEIKNNYSNSFCSDGFFWGQQFQEESVKVYKAQDKKFIKWCKEQIKNKKVPIYTCSW